MKPIEAFQDYVVELEQYRQATSTPKRALLDQPDCAEVIQNMTEIVVAEPEITQFYATALRRYRKTQPDTVKEAAQVIGGRISLMDDLELLTLGQYDRLHSELESGALVYQEAKAFFAIFKKVLDPQVIPKDKYRKRVRKPHPRPAPEIAEPIADIATEPETATEEDWVGKEYDTFVETYQSHPLNSLKPRYQRDLEGFNCAMPTLPTSEKLHANDGDWFAAYMGSFPLLDGKEHEVALKQRVELGLQAFTELQTGNPGPEHQKELEVLAIYGAGAFMTMYECNLRLVRYWARRYQDSPTYDIDDRVQQGCLGLRRAIQKFDPERGFKLSTYASNWIRQAIERGAQAQAFDTFIPAHASVKINQIKEIVVETKKHDLPEPTDKELKDAGYSPDVIFAARHLTSLRRVSLDKPFDNDSGEGLYAILPPDATGVEALLIDGEQRDVLVADIQDLKLTKNQRLMLSMKEGVVLPGVDYSKPVRVNGHPAQTLGELLLLVQGGVRLSQAELKKLGRDKTGNNLRAVNEVQQKVLLNASLDLLSQRLLLSDEERADMKHFILRDYRKDIPQPLVEAQNKARQSIDLLRLVDGDFEAVLAASIDYLKTLHKPNTVRMLEHWMRLRFGMYQDKKIIPTSYYSPQGQFSIRLETALRADVIFISTLAGAHGKPHPKLQVMS